MGQEATANRERKKQYGVFYTPSNISRILCSWAIRHPDEKILEPSFGGCGFLEESKARLIKLGSQNPNRQLSGCDVDHSAFQYLAKKIGPIEILNHFIQSDFLQLTPESFSANKFDVIVGNPPYVSNHNMSQDQKEAAIATMNTWDFSIGTKASLWAYFLLHSMQFLNSNGRMAWVLPGSFLYSNYASEVRSILTNYFESILAVSLGERVFEKEGTDEHTVLLLCEGYHHNTSKNEIELAYADNTDTLRALIDGWENGANTSQPFIGKYGFAMLPPESLKFYNTISTHREVVKFGELANVHIGIVTGDNKFFVINEEEKKINLITDSSVRYILAKFGVSSGLSLLINDLDIAKKRNERCLFVNTSRLRKTSRTLLEYLSTYPEDKKHSNRTFKKRPLWHRPDYGVIPDAFFPYMHHTGPRLVLNEAEITSTNTIHRVFFNKMSRHKKRLTAISMLTTFTQVSAEIEGRCYGSGVLKHEPSEAKEILLMMPSHLGVKEVNEKYKQIDHLLRKNELEEARYLADQFVFDKPIKLYGEGIIEVLNDALIELRQKRYKTRTN